jgi:hypothetical protein
MACCFVSKYRQALSDPLFWTFQLLAALFGRMWYVMIVSLLGYVLDSAQVINIMADGNGFKDGGRDAAALSVERIVPRLFMYLRSFLDAFFAEQHTQY